MNTRLDKELNEVYIALLDMELLTERIMGLLLLSFNGEEKNIKREAREMEEAVIAKYREIESGCVTLLLRYHPVARDLKRIRCTTTIIRDLERIADNALDIISEMEHISSPFLYKKTELDKMCYKVEEMLKLAIKAYIEKDIPLSLAVEKSDDGVDAFFLDAKRTLTGWIRENEEGAEEALDLMMIAKYLERMGDHATNISRMVGRENKE